MAAVDCDASPRLPHPLADLATVGRVHEHAPGPLLPEPVVGAGEVALALRVLGRGARSARDDTKWSLSAAPGLLHC